MPSPQRFPNLLETERLAIRAPDPAAAETVNLAIRDSFRELSAWLPWADHVPFLEETRRYLAEAQARFLAGDDYGLLLWERASGGFLGASGLHPRSSDPARREIGYWIRTSATARGYATEAVRAIALAGCAALRLSAVEIRASARNLASHRVAERAGFEFVAVLSDGRVDPDGEPTSTHLYVMRCADAPLTAP